MIIMIHKLEVRVELHLNFTTGRLLIMKERHLQLRCKKPDVAEV